MSLETSSLSVNDTFAGSVLNDNAAPKPAIPDPYHKHAGAISHRAIFATCTDGSGYNEIHPHCPPTEHIHSRDYPVLRPSALAGYPFWF